MKILRDKRSLTRFLILYLSAVEKPNKLSDLSESLDMSEQGVSNYLSDMEKEKLIDTSGHRYHPTSKGMEYVRDVIQEISTFLDEASEKIEFISRCTALADEFIEEGDEVGLFMKDGFLHAAKEGSSSMGTALMDAKEGEPVLVGGLRGITELNIGTLYILCAEIGDATEITASNLREKIKDIDYEKVAIMDEKEYGLANTLNIEPDIKFAPLESSLHAADKGLNVLFMVDEDQVDNIIEKIKARNRNRDEEYNINFKIL